MYVLNLIEKINEKGCRQVVMALYSMGYTRATKVITISILNLILRKSKKLSKFR